MTLLKPHVRGERMDTAVGVQGRFAAPRHLAHSRLPGVLQPSQLCRQNGIRAGTGTYSWIGRCNGRPCPQRQGASACVDRARDHQSQVGCTS